MMRTLTKWIFGLVVIGLTGLACKDEKKAEGAQTEPEATEASAEAPAEVASTTVLNANLATEGELSDLGLISPVVDQIMENRPFTSIRDLDPFLGDAESRAELYEKLFVPMNLNTTPEEDFKLIPGVGDRMAHEFEEYRPYTSIAQFRREIGKYVDEDEVARYEYYVFVPVELNTASEETIKALPGVGDRMAHEFLEYRPYTSMEQFRREIGKYVDDKELARLERLVYLKE